MTQAPFVSVIISTHNRKAGLFRLIESIRKSSYPTERFEVWVIDDASVDGTSMAVESLYQNTKLIRIENEVFPAKSRDIAARRATGEYLFFVDDDCVVSDDSITHLVDSAIKVGEKAGIVAPIIVTAEDPHKVWAAGGLVNPNRILDAAHLYVNFNLRDVQEKHELIDIGYSPSAYLIKKSVYLESGGFSYEDFPIAWEETDLALKVKHNGYRNICVTKALVFHDVKHNLKVGNLKRAYHQGKSRTVFYRKYQRRKLLFLPIYVAGFLLSSQSVVYTIKYVDGVIDGIARKSNSYNRPPKEG